MRVILLLHPSCDRVPGPLSVRDSWWLSCLVVLVVVVVGLSGEVWGGLPAGLFGWLSRGMAISGASWEGCLGVAVSGPLSRGLGLSGGRTVCRAIELLTS